MDGRTIIGLKGTTSSESGWNINGAPSIARALVRVHVDLIISMRGFLTMARCLNGSSGPNIIDSNERQANARMDGRPDIWRVSSVDKGTAGS